MLRGMTTMNLWAEDLPAASRWYTELLGVSPYFTSESAGRGPGYVEFRIACSRGMEVVEPLHSGYGDGPPRGNGPDATFTSPENLPGWLRSRRRHRRGKRTQCPMTSGNFAR
jgi:hypothetical protein